MTLTSQGRQLLPGESHGGSYSTGFLHNGDNHRQLPLMWPVPAPAAKAWTPAGRAATWLEISRMLPASLGVEFTREHGWRIIHVNGAMQRALDDLEAVEGPPPNEARKQAAIRRGIAEQQLAQARAVLRAVALEMSA